MTDDFIIVTLPNLPGYTILQYLGVVHSFTVRTTLDVLYNAKDEVLETLKEKAKRMGANAIIHVHFETVDIQTGTATVFSVYGTAVVVETE